MSGVTMLIQAASSSSRWMTVNRAILGAIASPSDRFSFAICGQRHGVQVDGDRRRGKGLPVVWTHVAYAQDASDAGVWNTRSLTAP